MLRQIDVTHIRLSRLCQSCGASSIIFLSGGCSSKSVSRENKCKATKWYQSNTPKSAAGRRARRNVKAKVVLKSPQKLHKNYEWHKIKPRSPCHLCYKYSWKHVIDPTGRHHRHLELCHRQRPGPKGVVSIRRVDLEAAGSSASHSDGRRVVVPQEMLTKALRK